jgi:hypothetical protein
MNWITGFSTLLYTTFKAHLGVSSFALYTIRKVFVLFIKVSPIVVVIYFWYKYASLSKGGWPFFDEVNFAVDEW